MMRPEKVAHCRQLNGIEFMADHKTHAVRLNELSLSLAKWSKWLATGFTPYTRHGYGYIGSVSAIG